ncbi:hypothetical protein [Verrucomicrobium sp. BvORR034]|uniref:hypothetical protein n=1 Tax=Verrucomicrobium sp. BvORR034 TaxID=1396418 RepID=UPI0006796AF2|nr:hypothetical protein [Verrucomicrobium sp. BvORR034]
MHLSHPLKKWSAVLISAAVAIGAWLTYDWHRHRVIVILPDGAPAQTPSVTLDYDPIYEYHPTIIHGKNGTVHIPRKRAYGRGWETMRISASKGDKKYYASRSPLECKYPMVVTLQELPPPPPPPTVIEQVSHLLRIFNALR